MADAILASSGIYAIRNKVNGKRYIGSSTNLRKRRERHMRELAAGTHSNRKLQNAVAKHGIEAFEFIVLEVVVGDELLLGREQYWIEETRATEIGYNLRCFATSNLGMTHDLVVRARIAESLSRYLQQPEVKAKMSAIRTGTKRSDETKARMSVSRTGIKHTEEARAKMRESAKHRPPQTSETRSRKRATMLAKDPRARKRASKMNEEKVIDLRTRHQQGDSISSLATRFALSVRQARDIAQCKAWKHVNA